MSSNHPVRVELALPALTPAQADLLWGFVHELASKLWDAYESELCHDEYLRSSCPDPEPDWRDEADDEVPFETSCPPHDPVANDEPDFVRSLQP